MSENTENTTGTQAVDAALARIWREVTDAEVPTEEASAGSLWSLGLTSAGFIQLLAAVEEGFGFDWDLDEAGDAVSSYDNLTAYVVRHATRLPEDAAATVGSR